MNRAVKLQRGVTLVELMVAIVISSLLALAVTSVMANFEGRRRTTTSINDINQAGNYAVWAIDDVLRSAGSGFAQTAGFSFGCKLLAAKGGVPILPAPAAFAAPFDSIGQAFRLAPALIVKDGTKPGDSKQGSDVLVVMGGAAGKSEVPAYLADSPSAASLKLTNTLSFSADDLILLADRDVATGDTMPCMFSQVDGNFREAGRTELPLAGTYYQAMIDSKPLSSYSGSTVALDMGNVTKGNPPFFALIGVGDNSSLYAYDLLQTSAAPQQALATGVFEMHALYGLDSNHDGKVDAWVKPEGPYSYATLTDGTVNTAGVIGQIKAIRVGLILRAALLERNKVSPNTLTLFGDLGGNLSYSRTLIGDETNYRYRTVEFSVPLRNLMMLE